MKKDKDTRPSLRGFRAALTHYNESNDLSYRTKNWFIAKGGYDLSFQIEYRTERYGWIPYIDCISWKRICPCQTIDDDVLDRMMAIMCDVFSTKFILDTED